MDIDQKTKEVRHRMISISKMETSYSYGASFSVNELLFNEGEITTVIGRNGSGKSTLLKTVTGFMPYKGAILIDGHESRSYTPKERARRVAYLPQTLKNINMDTITLVEHGRYPYHGSTRRLTPEDRKLVDHALDITDMKELRDMSLQEMSGGERQRAYLAMVIAQNTPMILLDEPTSYLDICYRKMFYETVNRLKEEGKGIVMSCHDLEQSFACSDRVVIMDDRTVKACGTPAELMSDQKLLRDVFGVSLVYMDDESLVHPYVMKG